MTALVLNASLRDTKLKAKALRRTGLIPAVLYGHGIENKILALDPKAFSKLFNQTGESSLIDLVIDNGQPISVLVKDVQYDLLKDIPAHVDLQQVRMDEAITAEVEFHLVGEAPAVKGLGAILVESLDHLKIECLPGDLQHEIEVDISGLAEFGQSIHISDLKLPVSWKLVGHEPEEVIVSVIEPKVEAEPVVEEAVVAEGEAVASEAEAKDKTEEAEKKD